MGMIWGIVVVFLGFSNIFFEKSLKSWKNHQQLIKIAFLGLWEYKKMIPHVVFLLGDGLKSYFGWINDVLRSKYVPK